MYSSIESVRDLHLEITSKCNVRCPQCPRNTDGGVTNPTLPQAELMLADVSQMFSPKFIAQLTCVEICGNYGDPAVAQDTLAVTEYFRRHNADLRIQINSHGSARSPGWWKELASVGVVCHFSIDGLSNTNHLYRRGTHWETILRNVRAFIGAGGPAIWDFVIFAHNEHQIDDARALATELGFKEFVPKKTVRFMRDGKMILDVPIYDKRGGPTRKLELPKLVQHQNQALRQMSDELGSWSDYERYIETTAISCKAVAKGGIYVSAEGLVFPCCYLGHIYPARANKAASQNADMLGRLPGGKSSICALLYSLEEILQGPLFQTVVPDGWANSREARLRTCSHQCGTYDLLSAQRG
jgi:MoaA/NifB/PqqE/SkfB family radical SAM enzyme